MRIGVVIPCYRVKEHILQVLAAIGPEVEKIYVVDDACPEQSGRFVESQCRDPRVEILFHDRNKGVGGAVMSGYTKALADGMEIVVKVDGDGQMDPRLIPTLVQPIVEGTADYTKGNRFFDLESLHGMPFIRIFGNTALSFIAKASSGYWELMDPTNGYTAIHRSALGRLPLRKIDQRYFFESDMLFRLNTIRAVVADVPMKAIYAEEKSSLKVSKAAYEFFGKHLVRVGKRIFYNYILRDFNVCSLELLTGLLLTALGSSFGIFHWYTSYMAGRPTQAGTVMVAALPVILGFQLLLAAISFDVTHMPHKPLQRRLA